MLRPGLVLFAAAFCGSASSSEVPPYTTQGNEATTIMADMQQMPQRLRHPMHRLPTLLLSLSAAILVTFLMVQCYKFVQQEGQIGLVGRRLASSGGDGCDDEDGKKKKKKKSFLSRLFGKKEKEEEKKKDMEKELQDLAEKMLSLNLFNHREAKIRLRSLSIDVGGDPAQMDPAIRAKLRAKLLECANTEEAIIKETNFEAMLGMIMTNVEQIYELLGKEVPAGSLREALRQQQVENQEGILNQQRLEILAARLTVESDPGIVEEEDEEKDEDKKEEEGQE